MKTRLPTLCVLCALCGQTALATVPATADFVSYACDGSDTAFTFSFGVWSTSEVEVRTITAAGVSTTLVENSDYTVTLPNGDGWLVPGGTVSMTTAPASGVTLWISRDLSWTQDSLWDTQSELDLTTLEADFDKSAVRDMQLLRQVRRALRSPEHETTDMNLPGGWSSSTGSPWWDGDSWGMASSTVPDVAASDLWAGTLTQSTLDASLSALGLSIDARALAEAADAAQGRDCWSLQKRAAIDVTEDPYNADPTGATDSSTGIQAAIDAAAAYTGSADACVVFPPGTYNLGTTGLDVPDYVYLIGKGRPYLLYAGTDFAIRMTGNYAMLRDVVVQVNTDAGQSDWFGGIRVGGAGAQASANIIDHCLIQGTETGTQADPYGVGVYFAGPNSTYPSYFNEIDVCRIRRWYRGTLHHDGANQQKYRGGLVEYYTLYGVDIGGSDENQMEGTFFQHGSGTSAYKVAYAVHLSSIAVLNQLSFGAEPGTYSSPYLCESSGNQLYSVNENGAYGGESDGLLPRWNTAGYFTTANITATESMNVFDSGSLGPEMIANGDFSTTPDTSWTWGSGWTLTDGAAAFAGGGTASLTQSLEIRAGYAYRISVALSGDSDSGVRIYYNGTNSFRVRPNSTKTVYFVASESGSTFTITPPATFSGSVDDVSVQQIIGGTLTVQGPIIANGGFVEDVNNIAADIVSFDTHGVHIIDSSGGAISGTLADGDLVGQTVTFVCKAAGNNIDITVAHHGTSDPETIRLDAPKDGFTVVWDGTDWVETWTNGTSYP